MKYITFLYKKYLDSLEEEISLYHNEDDLWKLTGDLKNTPANLALHICGNLKHNFGAVFGKNGYVRKRDLEFSKKGVSKKEILDEIASTAGIVIPMLESLPETEITKRFPEAFEDEVQSVGDALVRLAMHLGYHVGQINYHRRILTF